MALAAVLLAAAWTLLVVLLGATAAHADDRDGSSSVGTGLSGITAPVARLATGASASLHEAPVPAALQEVATAPVAAASSAATSVAQTASPVVESVSTTATTVTRAVAPAVTHVEQAVIETVTTAAAATKPVGPTVSGTTAAVRGAVRDTVESVPAVVDRTATVVVPPVQVPSAPRGPSIDIPAAPSAPSASGGTPPPATTPSAAPGAPAERPDPDAQDAARGSSSSASSVTIPSTRPALNAGPAVVVTAPEHPAPAGPEAPVAPAPVVSSSNGGTQQRGAGTGAGVPDATVAGGFTEPALLVRATSGGGRTAVPSGPTLSFDVSPD